MYYTNVAVLCCCLRMLENFIWRPRETRNTVNNKCEHGTRSFDAQQTHETLRGITFCVSSSLIIWLEGRKLRFFTSSQNCAESPAKLLSRLYIYLHYLHYLHRVHCTQAIPAIFANKSVRNYRFPVITMHKIILKK